jgi:hypothetical protein
LANTLGSPSLSTWYFVVCWHNQAAATINICVNDGAVDSAARTAAISDTAAGFIIGADGFNTTNAPVDGRIDEVGFWKRVLSAAEITELYNSGSGRNYAYISAGAAGTLLIHPGMTGGMREMLGGARG